jgi:hypothetical protein
VEPLAGSSAKLRAAFRPERLGHPTTVSVTVNIDPPSQEPARPLSFVTVRFPSDLGLATSGLGLSTCDPQALEQDGAGACPANSKMGGGAGTVLVTFGSDEVREHVTLGLYAAPSPDGYIHVSILAEGKTPVKGLIVMSGVIHPGQLQITVPVIPSLPETPDVAVVWLHATLGGALTYYERLHGRLHPYHPRGIELPRACPHGGFAFTAELAFQDGTRSSTRDLVPCPARRTGPRTRR